MCHEATKRFGAAWLLALAGALSLVSLAALAQTIPAADSSLRLDWRRIGNSVVDLPLAAPSGGPVDRVWYSSDGLRLLLQTPSGGVFESADFESWSRGTGVEIPERPALQSGLSVTIPEQGGELRTHPLDSRRLYFLGRHLYRSDDGGLSWQNQTAYRMESIIGAGARDLAVSPQDSDEVVVANRYGVWRSLDGGSSWSGLNDSLPNLPVTGILGLPSGSQGVQVLLDGVGPVEWAPGEKQAWRPFADSTSVEELADRLTASLMFGTQITALATAGDSAYAGSVDGRVWYTADHWQTWRATRDADGSPVEDIYVDPSNVRTALVAMGENPGVEDSPHVLRTTNAGLFWDDLTLNLPRAAAYAVTADVSTGAVYVATAQGLFFSYAELLVPGPPTNWTLLSESLPQAPVVDTRLDEAGNQLFVALEGYGVYAAMAPHRVQQLQVVNAADFSLRPAAPGSLLSVLGGRVESAWAGEWSVPILAASEWESQIQVPFEATGSSLSLALESYATGWLDLPVPLQEVSPAIFVDRDGTPMLLDADSGVMLDVMNPARSNARIQILATGLGRVRPNWPTGLAAPMEDPPRVAAPLRVLVDRIPVEVTRAVLAPGYVGFYLVEVQLPEIVNAGPAELHIEADGKPSNRVRIYQQP